MKKTTIYNHEADSLQEAIGINYNDELIEKLMERLMSKKNKGKASIIAETIIEMADTPEELVSMCFWMATKIERYKVLQEAVRN